MSAINGPSRIDGPQGLQGPNALRSGPRPQAASASRPATVDQLDISPEAAQAADSAAVAEAGRADRVAEIRAQIASGSYETSAKLDAALDRLLDEIG